MFGYGWSHSYATKLFITQDGDGAVSLGTGQELFFDWSATNQTFAPFDARTTATLVKHNDATFTFTAANSDQYHFDTTGRLSTISRGTNQASLGYDGSGRLSTVTASSGGTLTLAYDGNGRLGGVTGNNGTSVTYSYDGNGDLVGADRTNSGLDSYGYDRHRLSQVSNNGTILVQNSYDDYHRVTEHADSSGQSVAFHYRTPAVGVTAAIDLNSTYYYFDRFQRTTFVLYPDGSSITYVYDAIGNLIDTIYDGFNQPPTVTLTATPIVGETPLEVAFTATASDPDNDPLTYRWVFGDGTTGGNNATINHLYTGAGIYTATVSVSDTVATVSVPVAITVNPNLPDLIPDEITPTAPTSFAAAVDFLYTGTDPVQTGVLSGTIEAKRTAVLRGRVLTRAGQPLPGVQIAIHDHPEFGQTQSRIDGYFDMAVNGGGPLTLNFTHNGHLPVQRQQDVAWQDFTLVDDVVMTSLDPVVTTVDLNANTPIQVSRGSVVTDENGVRQSTLLIPQGVQATMRLLDGSTQPLTTVNIRSTEYTVGDSGPAAMPGSLPPQSGYTYAVELSVDEALAVGATDVHFTQPLYHYVENFINFPVGMAVPNGYYDRARAAWVPAPDGRVVKIVAINAGLADLDTNGDTVADNDVALGITTAERQQLALLYQSGQSLWRVPIDHFTPWDHNWPFGPPDDALPPDRMPPGYDKKPENPCEASGSIIECETQVVGQRLEVVGTPYTLNYRSDRTLGRSSFLDIPITGATLPESLASVVLVVSIAGKQTIVNFAPLPNQTYEFTWDHKDAYDRTVVGARKALVRIGYTYAAQYDDPQDSGNGMSFGNSSGISVSGSVALAEV